MSTLPLFGDDRALARNTDPSESHEAAARASHRVTKLQRKVLNALALRPMTTKEIAAIVGEPRDSMSPRMPALVKAHLVERSGERREGAAVWKLTEGLPK